MGGASETEVLIVGAGPTGQMLAAQLAARGVALRLVDKAPQRDPHSRALVVHARTLELLQRLGRAQTLVERGRIGAQIALFVQGQPVLELTFDRFDLDETPFPFPLFVSQAETERVLDEELAARGVRVERPVELVGLTQDEAGVSAVLRGPGGEERVRARYAVGCDGAHSFVRKAAGLSFEGAPYAQDFVLADCRVGWERPADQVSLLLGPRGVVVVIPLSGPQPHRVIASRGLAPEGASEPTLGEVEELVREVAPVPVRLSEPGWLARFRLHHRGVEHYRQGRLFVAGDAAHIHSPAGGQGMNTGIQDAANLGWKLARVLRDGAPEALLDSYHAERQPVGRRLLQLTDRLFELASSPSPGLLALRNALVPLVAPRAGAGDGGVRGFRFISQLAIRYRDSPTVGEHEKAAFSGGPGAGYRAPDGPLLTRTGPGRLYEQLGGVGHHLLVFGGEGSRAEDGPRRRAPFEGLATRLGATLLGIARSGTPAEREHLDPDGVLHARYGLSRSGYYLIRPDGHVAFRSGELDPLPLELFLQRVYGV